MKCSSVCLSQEELMDGKSHALFKPRKERIILTKKISPLKVSPASIASIFPSRMIQQMSLQMLSPRKRPSTSVIRANKLLALILAKIPSLASTGS